MSVPIIENEEIVERDNEDELITWFLEFSVRGQNEKYRLEIFLDNEGQPIWDYGYLKKFDGKRWIHHWSSGYVFKDHLFEQCVRYIKHHPQERLRLFHAFEAGKLYGTRDFNPDDYDYEK